MENTKTIVLELRLTRNKVLALLSLFFLAWHPAFIESETLTLTTYYPAPYGGYASILTTGQTLLARDSGNVGIGIGVPSSKLHVAGATTLSGSLYVGGALAIVNGTQANKRVLTSDGAGNATWATGGGPMECVWQNYTSAATTGCWEAGYAGQWVITMGRTNANWAPVAPANGVLTPTISPLPPGTIFASSAGNMMPTSGQMLCCKVK